MDPTTVEPIAYLVRSGLLLQTWPRAGGCKQRAVWKEPYREQESKMGMMHDRVKEGWRRGSDEFGITPDNCGQFTFGFRFDLDSFCIAVHFSRFICGCWYFCNWSSLWYWAHFFAFLERLLVSFFFFAAAIVFASVKASTNSLNFNASLSTSSGTFQ